MGEASDADIAQIMDQIRENIRRRRSAEQRPLPENRSSPFDEGHAAADFARLHTDYDIRTAATVSNRRVVGSVVAAARRLLRRLLAPILERQVAYNGASTRVTTHLKEWVGTLDREQAQAIQRLNGQMESFERTQTQFRDEMLVGQTKLRAEALALASQLRQELLLSDSRFPDLLAAQSRLGRELTAQSQTFEAALQAINKQTVALESRLRQDLADQSQVLERISSAERKLRRILHALENGQAQVGRPDTKSAGEKSDLPLPELEPDFDYLKFEERFRGDEEEIKERQRAYLHYFHDKENVVDIGCGRGEFLDLLRERGIKASGVDVDRDMVLLCREKGLNVVMEDAFAHLGSLPDDSVGGVFAAQVIEHLHPRQVIELVKLCYHKLAAGGVLILETPNPKCLMVFADSFYKDPSHVQPAHPDTMQFLLEATGFHDVELRFSAPVNPALRIPPLAGAGADFDRFNAGIERLNSLLFGFQDYAVIGRKDSARAH